MPQDVQRVGMRMRGPIFLRMRLEGSSARIYGT